ncbi:MAG: tetratricopeptide repeat protein [Gemmatimonadetes bacterium]|nr:tetratricopeptide repeat protein [Gemmatimonadota bacterium]MYA65633.1 tetratricopeptide repeat protein [Gemmatimonadota bacterium]MYB98529.1 tetratricopeptide repeat protein [Gemmatimonadota bacterium]MYH52206.1 tetratricopeptide repeat protein [Gemmatimonadota bacterium]MYI46085.1 tetratricopeptide repeat protein [Gemmatimonadota bacterium]
MESRDAGYDRSERVLRWMAAGLGAALFVAALACNDEKEGEPMEQVAYAEVGSQTVMTTSAPGQAQMPVSPGMTTAPAETIPSSPEVGETAARAGDETPEPEATETPMAPWEHYDEGIAAWKSGETTDAETHLREWVAYAPEHVKGRVNLARVLIEIGRPHEAKEHAKLAADLDPGSVAAKRVLARALAEGGDSHAALAMYEEALWLDPDDFWSLNNMGYLLILRGRHEEAVGPLALAAQLDSTNAMFRSNLGSALEGAGYPAAALKAFAAAVAIDPGHTRAAASVVRLRELLGEDAVPEVDTSLLADNYRKGLMGMPEREEPDTVEYAWRGD